MARMLGSTGTDHGGRRMPLVADVSSPGATTSERRDSSNQPIVPRGAGASPNSRWPPEDRRWLPAEHAANKSDGDESKARAASVAAATLLLTNRM